MKITQKWILIGCLAVLLSLTGQAPVSYAEGDFNVYLPVVSNQFIPGPGVVTGLVLDAGTRNPIPGIEVCFQGSLCDNSDGDGRYSIGNIPAGWRTLTAAALALEYFPSSASVIVNGYKTSTLDFALSLRSLGEIDYRVVLTWDPTIEWPPLGTPNDMDAHLWVSAALPYHLFYAHNPEDFLQYPYARLEIDYTAGFGPETIDVERLVNFATYHFAVDNVNYGYPGVPPHTELGAQVQVYAAEGLLRTFTVPNIGDGDVWYVFRMSDAGTLVEVNCLTYMNANPDLPPECPAK